MAWIVFCVFSRRYDTYTCVSFLHWVEAVSLSFNGFTQRLGKWFQDHCNTRLYFRVATQSAAIRIPMVTDLIHVKLKTPSELTTEWTASNFERFQILIRRRAIEKEKSSTHCRNETLGVFVTPFREHAKNNPSHI